MPTNDQLAAWDRASFAHPSTPWGAFERGELPSRIMTGGEGVHVVDRDGNRFLDAFAGLYCVNVGYGRPEIADAIAQQAKELAYYHAYVGHGTEVSIKLARMIAERAPAGLNHVYFGLSGSDANETNLKLLWYYNNVRGRPEKKTVVSRWRGYHGSGLMTGSLTGLELFHNAFDLPLARVVHTEAPYYFRRPETGMSEDEFSTWCAERLEALILDLGPDTVAGFIGEPVLGTGGIVPPPAGYWPKIQAVLETYDVLLIADEVVTGFGRLGAIFGSAHYGMRPDLVTLAKGLSSAYAPISGSIVSDRMWEVLSAGTDELGPMGHGWTYSAHPLCAAAAVANLELVDRLDLVANARTVGAHFNARLHAAVGDHPHVGEVRGEGLLAAVELAEDKAERRLFAPSRKLGQAVVAAMLRRGVIARPMPEGDIVGFAPPLCLTHAEADRIVEATRDAIVEVLGS
jgi:L-2,4-diaminobutyrate transaminase